MKNTKFRLFNGTEIIIKYAENYPLNNAFIKKHIQKMLEDEGFEPKESK